MKNKKAAQIHVDNFIDHLMEKFVITSKAAEMIGQSSKTAIDRAVEAGDIEFITVGTGHPWEMRLFHIDDVKALDKKRKKQKREREARKKEKVKS